MPDISTEQVEVEWPREIWAEERQEGDMQGLHVFSEHATVPRFEGDRDGECHRYVDGDIYDSQVRWAREMIASLRDALANTICIRCERRIGDEWPSHYICVSCGPKRKLLAQSS